MKPRNNIRQLKRLHRARYIFNTVLGFGKTIEIIFLSLWVKPTTPNLAKIISSQVTSMISRTAFVITKGDLVTFD